VFHDLSVEQVIYARNTLSGTCQMYFRGAEFSAVVMETHCVHLLFEVQI